MVQLLLVPMVYSGMLIEEDAGCEVSPSVAVDLCVLNIGFMVGKSVTFGHGIAIEAAHGVFLLVAAFTLRRASSVVLFSSVMLCVDVRRLVLTSCFSSVDIFSCLPSGMHFFHRAICFADFLFYVH